MEHGLDLPAKRHNGEVIWRLPHYTIIHRMIENPIYGGVYAYGKSRVATGYNAAAAADSATASPLTCSPPPANWFSSPMMI
jgi:hypothetical protein